MSVNILQQSGGLDEALRRVCSQKECLVKRANACSRLLNCNHNCGGICNEEKCLPCLECITSQDVVFVTLDLTGNRVKRVQTIVISVG